MVKKLTKPQQRIYDLIPDGEWIYEEIIIRHHAIWERQVNSQLDRMFRAGFLERRIGPEESCGYFWEYRKIKLENKE